MRKRHSSLILWTLLGLLSVSMAGAGTGGQVPNRDDLSLVNPLEGSFGSALNSTTLAAAINAIGSDRKILMITPSTWTISTNLTIPENVGIRVVPGAVFSVNGSRTLAIKGTIEAPLQHIFTGAGTITVGTRILVLRAEWWGTKCDHATNDHSSLQAAMTAAGTSGVMPRLALPEGRCRIGTGLILPPQVLLEGDVPHRTTLEATAAIVLVTMAAGDPAAEVSGGIRNLRLEGNHLGTIGLRVQKVAYPVLEDIYVNGFTQKGVEVLGSLVFEMVRPHVSNSVIGIDGTDHTGTGANLVRIRGGAIRGNATYGLQWANSGLLMVDGTDFETNGTAGNAATGALKVSGMCTVGEGVGLSIKGAWFELNNGHSAIRLNAPGSNPCFTHIDSTLIISGTRSYGIYIASPNKYVITASSAQNATQADYFDETGTEGLGLQSIGSTASFSGQTTRLPDPLLPSRAFWRYPTQMLMGKVLINPGVSTETPDADLNLGSQAGRQTSGSVIQRIGAVGNPTPGNRGSGIQLTVNHATPAAANTNSIMFGFRNNAGTGEGAAAVISATKGAGIDTARLEFSVGTGSGGTGSVVGRFDPTAAAGETRFWLYDETDATLKRVKLGADGSCAGGAGKCLYVDN